MVKKWRWIHCLWNVHGKVRMSGHLWGLLLYKMQKSKKGIFKLWGLWRMWWLKKTFSPGFLCLVTRCKKFLTKKELQIEVSSVMPLTFNAMELCIVSINEKPWTCGREVWRALQYNKKNSKHCQKPLQQGKLRPEVLNEQCTHCGYTCGLAKRFTKIRQLYQWRRNVWAFVFKSTT